MVLRQATTTPHRHAMSVGKLHVTSPLEMLYKIGVLQADSEKPSLDWGEMLEDVLCITSTLGQKCGGQLTRQMQQKFNT